MTYKQLLATTTFAAMLMAAAGASASTNLLVNGGFELTNNGYSETETPVGWTNIGHIDGVIAYDVFNTPAYDGNYFYDEGGYGDPENAAGDGIEQTVSTTPGESYSLTFGLTGENVSGEELADVTIGSELTQYTLEPDSAYGELAAPFKTYTLNYVANSATTTIAFTTDAASPTFGSNDPMIDGVSFTSAAPEPSTWAFILAGVGMIGIAIRQSKHRRGLKVLNAVY